jgi:PAS domain S-box-containing protein
MAAESPLEILVVEDDPGMALLVAERLGEVEGWGVTTAHSAAECRARVAEQSFDVILLDRGLPDCDGATLIQEFLARQSDVAIIMLTGADSADSATETLQMGAWDYVVKRPDLRYLEELPGMIRRWAGRLAWRRERARLQEEVDLLLAAMRCEADAVIVVGVDGTVQFWNAAAERLFGWTADEILHQPLPVIPSAYQAQFNALGERARAGQPLVGVEAELQRRDGSRVEVGLTLTAVTGADDAVRAYVGVVRDISERKQIERDRADFAAMLTHDMKNPLMVIQGYAEMLAGGGLPPELADLAARIQRAAHTMQTLVTNFLTSATIESGNLTLERERIGVAEWLAAAVRQFAAEAARARVTLTLGPVPPAAAVTGDRVQLERVLNNLIGNAIKYTPAGGTVTVDAAGDGAAVCIRVADTGLGIAAEELPCVFEKYRRQRDTRRIDGTGLGLYIVKSLVEAHGGRVTVASETGRGTTFEVRLPAAQ